MTTRADAGQRMVRLASSAAAGMRSRSDNSGKGAAVRGAAATYFFKVRTAFYRRKIVKGERRGKKKNGVFRNLTLPSRLLSSLKIVKGERRGKRKTEFFAI